MTTLRKPRRHRGTSGHADALYGLLYPANHLRIVSFVGDPADLTCGLLTFDRNLAPLPGGVEFWAGNLRAGAVELANPRVARLRFNGPLSVGWAWTFDPCYGSFRGADGCAMALAASGVIEQTGGAIPGGKIYIATINWVNASEMDFVFSQNVTVGGGDPNGFWCLDELGNTQAAPSAWQMDATTARASFGGTIPSQTCAGLAGGFNDVVEYADVLCPVTWRV